MRRPRFPLRARTIRARLAIRYAAVAFLSGAALLAFSYVVVRQQIGPGSSLEGLVATTALPAHAASPSRSGRTTRRRGAEPARFTASASTLSPDALALVFKRDARALRTLLLAFAAALAVMTLVSALVGWLLARRALAPVARITATAQRVSQRSLHERITLDGPHDELRELGDTFNGMLDSLETAFQNERRFVANASHELRTPLAVVRTALDVSAEQPLAPETDADTRATIHRTLDAAEHLVERLLVLAQSNRGVSGSAPVDLTAVVEGCIRSARADASRAGAELLADLQPVVVEGDPALLATLVTNLVDNAIRYGGPGHVAITLVTGAHGDEAGAPVELAVRSGGAVIPEGVMKTLLQPFARGDERVGHGAGLGLSIVDAVATAHGGSVVLAPGARGGLSVTVSIPAA